MLHTSHRASHLLKSLFYVYFLGGDNAKGGPIEIGCAYLAFVGIAHVLGMVEDVPARGCLKAWRRPLQCSTRGLHGANFFLDHPGFHAVGVLVENHSHRHASRMRGTQSVQNRPTGQIVHIQADLAPGAGDHLNDGCGTGIGLCEKHECFLSGWDRDLGRHFPGLPDFNFDR